MSKAFSQVLKIEDIPELIINSETTSPGYPYAFDIFKDVPHIILDSTSYHYKNANDDTAKHYAVLYIHPANFSIEDFDRLSLFFQNEWPNIKIKVPLNQGYRKLNIVALVYGIDKQFEQQYLNKDKHITAQTDGQILYSNTIGSVQSTNLSSKVQMPGKVIYVEEGGQYSIDDLRMFRSKRDRVLELDFQIEVKTGESNKAAHINTDDNTCHLPPEEYREIFQTIFDFPELQQCYHIDKDATREQVYLQYADDAGLNSLMGVKKFNKQVKILTEKEIKKQNIPCYFVLKTLDCRNGYVKTELFYVGEGLAISTLFRKLNNKWTVESAGFKEMKE